MRVIAGSAKGTPLQAVPGGSTRPISDRVKEALFDILSGDIVDARVLDLFAGTGSVGIEALSRGAAGAVLVEKRAKAVQVIRANLRRTHLQAQARVVQADVFKFLARPPEPFDLIYVAPPQYKGLWSKTLQALTSAVMAAPSSVSTNPGPEVPGTLAGQGQWLPQPSSNGYWPSDGRQPATRQLHCLLT